MFHTTQASETHFEEAPSPAINPELRSKITRAAVKLAKSVGYATLGTVESLLDSNRKFYFMEMNTRIQVEHPLTETITGFNLVDLQFRIASGERLNIAQKDVVLNGWAIEFRINAEDVQSNFASSLGYVKSIRFPQGNKIRIDTVIIPETEIKSWLDSMLAKLIVYGQIRDEAIKRACRALKHFQVKGIKTKLPFCKAILENEKFVNGDYDTSFIDSQPPKNLVFKEKEENFMEALLAVYLILKGVESVSYPRNQHRPVGSKQTDASFVAQFITRDFIKRKISPIMETKKSNKLVALDADGNTFEFEIKKSF